MSSQTWASLGSMHRLCKSGGVGGKRREWGGDSAGSVDLDRERLHHELWQ